MDGLDMCRRMRLVEPEQFHALVKMHLSFLLDLHTDECDCSFLIEKPEKETVDSKLKKAFTPMKSIKAKTKGVMDGVPLTQEGVCQVYQIIEFLGRPHNITAEGIFRKHGNLKKQQALKERLNKGIPLDLDDEEFSVHECAAVLKMFLANLPEPLLTDAYYRAHCQVAQLVKPEMSETEKSSAIQKQISCVQLLFQLIPPVHLALLKDLLLFLHAVALRETDNKMNSTNLGTMFSTHILCPRKMSPEALQSNHQILSGIVTFMIEHAEKLFELPDKLMMDVQNYVANKDLNTCTPQVRRKKPCTVADSPVVSTVFSFVDRQATQAATNGNETDKALAQLYAHVQSLPDSTHTRRLVKQLNEANGKGTPDVATSGSVRTVGRGTNRVRRKSGDGLMNLLTPRRKRPPVTGSYSVQAATDTRARRDQVTTSTSFRRQISQPSTPVAPPRSSLLSPSHHSSPAVLESPLRERLPSPVLQSTPNSQVSEVSPVDEVDTPGRDSASSSLSNSCLEEELEDEEEIDTNLGGSFLDLPPLPPRTPAPKLPEVRLERPTPPSLSPGVKRAMETPRSREGLMVSMSQLEKWNKLLGTAEPREVEGGEEEGEGEVDMADKEEITWKEKSAAYRSRCLTGQFKAYLAQQGLHLDGEESEDSLLEDSYSEEVRRLLRGPAPCMSTSMQKILDGEEPNGSPGSNTSRLSVRSCVSTTTLKTVPEVSGNHSENTDPSSVIEVPRRGVKRRSLTDSNEEIVPLQMIPPTNNIYFETDL